MAAARSNAWSARASWRRTECEVASLRVADIDSGRKVIRVEHGNMQSDQPNGSPY